MPETQVEVQKTRDPRSYRVNFDRIKERLGFEVRWRLIDGIRELTGFIKNIPDPYDRHYYNYPPEY